MLAVFVQPELDAHPLHAGADAAVAAALSELPEALVVVFDRELRFVRVAGRVLGRMADPHVCGEGQFLGDAFPSDAWRLIEPLFRSALEGETRSREIWSGEQRYCLLVDVGPLPTHDRHARCDPENSVAGGVAMVLDISARRRVDAFASRPLDQFEQVSEQPAIGTGVLDLDGHWLLVSRTLAEISGHTVEELLGTRLEEILHPDDADNDVDQRECLLACEIPAFQIHKRLLDAAGETVSAILSLSLVRDRDGVPLSYVAQLQDISERRELEEHLRHLADHDPLTGLRNRRLFEHDVKLQVARARRYEELAAVMVIDLDDFRVLNHRHGHTVGDEMLKAVARALTRRLRESDLVARLGGDEFAVLLPYADREGADTVAEGLDRAMLACGLEIGDAILHPSASIGVAIIDERAESAEQVMAQADRAMQAAKRSRPMGFYPPS